MKHYVIGSFWLFSFLFFATEHEKAQTCFWWICYKLHPTPLLYIFITQVMLGSFWSEDKSRLQEVVKYDLTSKTQLTPKMTQIHSMVHYFHVLFALVLDYTHLHTCIRRHEKGFFCVFTIPQKHRYIQDWWFQILFSGSAAKSQYDSWIVHPLLRSKRIQGLIIKWTFKEPLKVFF